jgi:hypothetical protein
MGATAGEPTELFVLRREGLLLQHGWILLLSMTG